MQNQVKQLHLEASNRTEVLLRRLARKGSTKLEQHNASGNSEPPVQISKALALLTFDGPVDGDLAFEKGDILEIEDTGSEGWWKATLNGKSGIIPPTYVRILLDANMPESSTAASPSPEPEAATFQDPYSSQKPFQGQEFRTTSASTDSGERTSRFEKWKARFDRLKRQAKESHEDARRAAAEEEARKASASAGHSA